LFSMRGLTVTETLVDVLTQPQKTRISEPERMLNSATRFARVRGIALLLVDHCKKPKPTPMIENLLETY